MNRPKATFRLDLRRLFFASCLFCFAGATGSLDAKIVFCQEGDIYVMNDDGSRRRRLTHSTQATHAHPRWSPDGKRIGFTRYMDKTKRQTTAEIFIMNADGTDPQRLTHNHILDVDSSWSPAGKRIAFSSGRNGKWGVFVIEIATHAVTPLTGVEDKGGSAAPDWSPDGRRIVFERFIPIEAGIAPKTIYVMSADGQHQHRVLPDPAPNDPPTFRYFPRWSADGQRILFYEAHWFEEGNVTHFIIQRLGGGTRKLMDINDRLGNNFLLAGASWMSDDREILFSLMFLDKSTPNYNLYRYGLETGSLRRLTRETSDEKWPDWREGTLSVFANEKLATQWAEIKVGTAGIKKRK